MFELIGLIFGLFLLGCVSLLLGGIIAGCAWLFFWGRAKPRKLILQTASIPAFTVCYLVLCGVCFTIFVPNQPDVFFGDFKEPVPNGYLLTGLGKMPDYSFFESTPPMAHQPPLLGGVRSLEQDGTLIFGAYGHLIQESSEFASSPASDHGFFAFDSRTGQVRNFGTLNELNAYAGHTVHLVASESFRSQDSGRLLLRRVENVIYFGPPATALLLCLSLLVRVRLKGDNSDQGDGSEA